jgi:4-hydroxybenzoate polyprenyltransferase
MACAAVTGAVPATAWWLVAANLLWVVAYDTMYAMADREEDLRVGVKSTAILFGRYDRPIVGLLQLAALAMLVIVGIRMQLGVYYFGGIATAAGFALYQQFLIQRREPAACFQAFLNNAWFGAAVFLGLVLEYL